ncbi:argininosuccinate synthetase [Protomyces lactucae-debilis]|uniref:Argininosuccinate synthase n=1 Tax=Protomyces lactucae-debilis TaxID=2754530 RepID=A0A1Y2F0J9_PROLT|nr:argininosuccinate synthetase [Protomyces lactucae-debilis]ORY77363.1 argininosuccinate synthetase [Protomyces lactucae-debilis]
MSKGKVCLAYSGGLDTSCIAGWLIEQGYEVIAFMANIGQEEDFEAARAKALKIGCKEVHIEDVRSEFVTEICHPAIQCNAIYENVYMLGTALARPIIARAQIAVAERTGCGFVSHGCTGKGNDQVRFELAFYALKPDIKVIAPWRDPAFYNRFVGRSALLDFAASRGIPVSQTAAKPFSEDENLAHISYEAGILEDPNTTPPDDMWKLTVDPRKAPDTPEELSIDFKEGIPVKLVLNDGEASTDPLEMFLTFNKLARKHGVGRIDIVENRFIGVKSRGCYETPALTILRAAHIDLEGLTLDRDVRATRDQFITPKFSELLYNGAYFSPLTQMLLPAIKASQVSVTGNVRLSLYKGSVRILGRSSEYSLYDEEGASMDQLGGFDPAWSTGFIEVSSIRFKKWAQVNAKIQGK